MVATGNGELGFDSGEGAWETATTSKEGSRRANYPIPTRGGESNHLLILSIYPWYILREGGVRKHFEGWKQHYKRAYNYIYYILVMAGWSIFWTKVPERHSGWWGQIFTRCLSLGPLSSKKWLRPAAHPFRCLLTALVSQIPWAGATHHFWWHRCEYSSPPDTFGGGPFSATHVIW